MWGRGAPGSKVDRLFVGRSGCQVRVENVIVWRGDFWSEQKFPLWGAGHLDQGGSFNFGKETPDLGKALL